MTSSLNNITTAVVEAARATGSHERLEQPGSTYALHHTSVHTVQAEADTITRIQHLIADLDPASQPATLDER
ncbi:MAG: hypothetical protein WCF33_13770 [Pseudonocardiaceae bacterium]